MKYRSTLALASAAALAVVATPALAATYIFDDWEDTDFGEAPGYQILSSYSGWNDVTLVTNSGIEVQYNNVAGTAYSGKNFVELDSNLNSTMEYESGLEAANYGLSFYYSNRPNTLADTNGLEVLLNGSVIHTVLGGDGGSDTEWVLESFRFTAADGDILGIRAIGISDSYGSYIDNLNLEPVPEPATWAMMLIGFGFIGAAMRRNQRRTVRYNFA